MDARRASPLTGKTWVGFAALAWVLLVIQPAWASQAVSSAGTRYAQVRRACPPPEPGSATCFALVRSPVSSIEAGQPGVKPFTVNDGASESGPAGGLTPAQLESAYGYDSTAGGEGQTVAIVDAYDDPNIESDLGKFDTQYGLPACTKSGCLTKVSQTGSTTSLPEPDPTGWSVEITLDVETVHSACPKCKILLVEANSASFKDLATAVSEAASLKATEISNSYGGPEEELGTIEKLAYNEPGVVIAAATGDYGWDDWTEFNEGVKPPARPNIPASLPSVVAVGGTSLHLTKEAKRESESAWNGNGAFDESKFAEGATGGGCSTLFIAQPWQQDVPGFEATGCGSKRLSADVSAVGDPITGFDIFDSYNCGKACEAFKRGKDWLTIGGTSLATPLISSLYALAGGADGVPYPALTLYGHLGDPSSLYDVTNGGNGFCDDGGLSCGANSLFKLTVDCEGTTACNAATGFDGPTGVGTPNSLSLFKPLLPTAVITPPGSLKAGASATFSASASSDPYPGGSDIDYSWSWGDGTADSSGVTPTHTYAEAGNYQVTLTVTDNYGLSSASATQSVNVNAESHEEELARIKREEEAAVTKKHEEEAAAAKKHEEEKALVSSAPLQGAAGFQSVLPPAIPDAQLAGTALQVSRTGLVSVKISCPIGESSCVGTLTLRTLGAVSAAVGNRSSRKTVLTLASGSFAVAGGKAATIKLHLSSKALALLLRAHVLRVRATILAHDPAGATHTGQTIVTLRPAPKSRSAKG